MKVYNDAKFCVDIMNSLLLKRDMSIMNLEKYRDVFDFPVKDYYKKVGFDFNIESFEKVGTEFINEYNNRRFECELHEGIESLINKLYNNSIIQFVLSAREEKKLIEDIKYYKIDAFFKEISGLSDHYANGKIELGKSLMQRNKISNEKCLLIGDTNHDAEVAKELNVDCVLISNGHHPLSKLEQCNVPVFNSVKELEAFLLFK